jgi:hypothetical protein
MRQRSAIHVVVLASVFALAACPGPSGGGDAGPGGERSGSIDFMQFVQDRPAVGGDWYDYDEEGGHVLTPFPHAYLVREGSGGDARYAALRIVTYYDPDTADSGRFTVSTTTWDGSWGNESEWLTSKNIKEEGPLCLELFSSAENDCAGSDWQVQLRAYSFLAREGPIVVTRPGLFVRSAAGLAAAGDVAVATVDNTSNLSGLPAPATLADLVDGDAANFASTEWSYGNYAVNLPRAGMAIGRRFVDAGFVGNDHVWVLLNARRSVVRFVVEPLADGDTEAGLRFTFTRAPLDLLDNTIPLEASEPLSVNVDVPAAGEETLLWFEADDLAPDPDAEATLPHLPPRESGWDLRLRRADDGEVQLLVSPGAAVYNATALDGAADLDAMPPEVP